jgi:hypothetical protein
MLQRFRGALIGTALGIAAILVVALLDGAFLNLLPSVSNLRVGQTNLATCLVMAELGIAFLLAGYLGRRWHSALVWVLLPVVALYIGAIATAPYVYGCDPVRYLWGCAFVHSPFVIGIVASCIGYVASRTNRNVPHVV